MQQKGAKSEGVIDLADKVKYYSNGMEGRPSKTNLRLIRTGITSDDYSEMTPVVFKGKLFLLATARPTAEANPYPNPCLWIEDVAAHRVVATFGEGSAYGSGFVHDDTFYALIGTTPSWKELTAVGGGGSGIYDAYAEYRRKAKQEQWEKAGIL